MLVYSHSIIYSVENGTLGETIECHIAPASFVIPYSMPPSCCRQVVTEPTKERLSSSRSSWGQGSPLRETHGCIKNSTTCAHGIQVLHTIWSSAVSASIAVYLDHLTSHLTTVLARAPVETLWETLFKVRPTFAVLLSSAKSKKTS